MSEITGETMILRLLAAAMLCVLMTHAAHARPRHHHRLAVHSGSVVSKTERTVRPMPPGLHRVMAEGAGRVVGHPPGCPPRAFCGCGAAVRIFGKPVRSLWRAANWFRFPRTSPAPGAAAVKRHHVFVLLRHINGPTWLVYDANSGRHRTRVHPRSTAGWAIVDPRGA
jgi:hypothetical protein